MRKIRRQIRPFIQSVILLFFVVFQFLSCLQKFDNPVDPDYKGDYRIENTQYLQSNLEILNKYTISYKQTGTNYYWKVYLHSTGNRIYFKDTIFKTIPIDTLAITFRDTFNGHLYLIGEKPNRQKDSILLCDSVIHIINPYSIEGKTRAGINEDVPLSIYYKGQQISKNKSEITATWDKSTVISIDSPYTIKNENRICSKKAELILNAFNATCTLTHLVTFQGYSPKITSFDTLKNLTFGMPARFKIQCSDSNKNTFHYTITGGEDILLDTTVDKYSDSVIFTTDTICDTLFKTIKLRVSDSDTLEDTKTISKEYKVNYIVPIVKIDTSCSVPAINDPFMITVNGSADIYHWKFRNVTDSQTLTKFLNLPPYTDTTKDTIYVHGENIRTIRGKTVHFLGKTDSIILSPFDFKYRIIPIQLPPYVKTKTWNSIQFAVIHGTDTVPDDSLRYVWELTDTSGSKFNFNFPKENGPILNIYLADSIQFFNVKVKAVLSTDSTQTLLNPIQVRSFRPFFAFKDDTISISELNKTVSYTSYDTNQNGGIAAIYYRQLPPSNDTSTYKISVNDSLELKFKTIGTIRVEGWAVDNDSNASKKDTLICQVYIGKPMFKDSAITDSISFHDTCHLQATLLNPKKDEQFLWDTNGDGLWEDSSNIDTKDITFPDTGNYVCYAQLRNGSGDSAIYRMSFNIKVKRNAPETETFTCDTFLYIKDSITFHLKGSDPDSSLTGIYLYRFTSTTDSMLIDSLKIQKRFSIDTTFQRQVDTAGTYNYAVSLHDRHNNITQSNKIKVTVDKGVPAIDSITIDTSIYVNDTIKFSIKAKDPNGYISKVLFFWNNDTTKCASIINSDSTRDTFSFSRTFAVKDSGVRKISFKVFDDDMISATKDTSIFINKGGASLDNWYSDSINYWANDLIPFHFLCHDTNGTIRRIIINWGDEKKIERTNINKKTCTLDEKHKYPIVKDTTYNITIQLTDDDTITSIYNDTIRVLQGAPIVSLPKGGDTLFVPVIQNSDTITIEASDPNDSIVKYYWDWGPPFDTLVGEQNINKSKSWPYTFAGQAINTVCFQMAVFAKDSDGNVGGKTFYVYPDGPPPAPTIVKPTSSTAPFGTNDTVTFEWYGTDVHDSINTEYEILIAPPGTPDSVAPNKSILDFTRGDSLKIEFIDNRIHFKFRYHPESTGTYRWTVTARDRNSLIAASTEGFSRQ